MITYSNQEGFIKPIGIKFRKWQDKNIILPEVAAGVFSRHLFNDIVEKFSCNEVGYFFIILILSYSKRLVVITN